MLVEHATIHNDDELGEEHLRVLFSLHLDKLRAFLVLVYATQVGQAFLPATQRTGLEACPYLYRMRYTC